ncbi:ABC transporter ATP-binding protein [Sphaerotilus mobilis]|uniref:Amino acid/amide ABC transporter ATP-binding protein 1 (HAAT family) n=1 Tax=Sphaerotilus mobilis TaxID=47994 RepID=A0A4Q7LBC5_9BURK|nr:ABC transporter ATP-binding protein [Sphaerotilus mobilis]RZS46701.1 amino acid/amide ABC transporter ATP-binding protein 1 (HAAT family) [Sphaerotilus mobilis]
MAALQTEGLVKRFGALLVTDDVSLDIRSGELHALIGPNGAGKTTLINQLSGELRSSAGRVLFDGRDLTALPVHQRARAGLLRSYQITSIFEEFTVRENAMLSALGARQHAWSFWRPMLANPQARAAADEAIEAAGLGAFVDTAAGELAYGQRRQLELAMALAAQPRFLLLDEPMAGMSVQESAAVTALLQRLKRRYTILLVEHDMDAVFALADRISVLVYGRVIFTGTPDEIRAHPEVRAVYLGEEST